MNPESLLDQLKDLHGPAAISWWPPAPGWWIVGIIILVCIIMAVRQAFKWHKKNAWKRQAIKELEGLKRQYLNKPSSQSLTEIICLLKRCASSAAQDRTVLALNSADWKTYLKSSPAMFNDSELDTLCFGHYQKEILTLDVDMFVKIEKWIGKLS